MIDTNAINQASDVVRTAHEQLAANWPAICAVAVLVARELKAFNAWLAGAAGFVIKHGGAAMILRKLIWNPGVPPVATNPPVHESTNPPTL